MYGNSSVRCLIFRAWQFEWTGLVMSHCYSPVSISAKNHSQKCIAHLPVCVCVCVYICMYVRTYVCGYVSMYVCMYVCMYVRMCVCMYI
jgi:hypothetical protein